MREIMDSHFAAQRNQMYRHHHWWHLRRVNNLLLGRVCQRCYLRWRADSRRQPEPIWDILLILVVWIAAIIGGILIVANDKLSWIWGLVILAGITSLAFGLSLLIIRISIERRPDLAEQFPRP
ncbi:hypothetical protein HY346_01615 [Candidatus Microgenomates bacterium]|nr:hypothetical protein [Candidatus Microgenomates bacterium]